MQPTLLRTTALRRIHLSENSGLTGWKTSWLQDALTSTFPVSGEAPLDPSAWRAFADRSVELAKRYLPAEGREALDSFFSPEGPDALWIENLPVDPELPRPPADGKRPAGKTPVSEAVIAGLLEGHAAIVSFLNEKDGAPIHEITPVAGSEHTSSSAGRVPFACHTDAAFLAPRFSPRGLLLFGLLNEPGAHTAVLPLDRILDVAPPALVRSLEKPIFRHPSPSSFHVSAAVIAPILWANSDGIPRIAVQTHAVQPVNDEAAAAITQLRALLDTLETERVVLRPGDALLFKNDRVLHGRDAFSGERWLQRAYFTDSLAPFRERSGVAGNAFVFDAAQLL